MGVVGMIGHAKLLRRSKDSLAFASQRLHWRNSVLKFYHAASDTEGVFLLKPRGNRTATAFLHSLTLTEGVPMKEHGPWKITASREVYRDPWIAVVRDEVVRPDGDPGSYCVIHIKPGVSVLAMDDERRVYLTEEFHYAIGSETIEAVSGGIDEAENSLAAAKRELREELGIEATDWTDLGRVDPFTANVLSPTQLYLAQQLTFGATAQEGTELIRCRSFPLQEVVQMVMEGRITHAPSCVAILKTWIQCGNQLANDT
jgi:ADP-ribose pyrophosphatase